MKDVSYSKEILDLIKKLTKLSNKFIIKKENGLIAIRAISEKSIFVEFISSEANFDFDGERIGFVENAYNKFYDFLTSFKKPKLKHDKDKLIIQDGNSSIKFRLSDPAIIKNSFKSTKPFPDSAITIKIPKQKFIDLKDMVSMIASENVVFKINGKMACISVANINTENAFELEIEMEKDAEEVLEMPVKATIFQNAPELDYNVHILQGAFFFQSVNENFTLNMFTGQKVSVPKV